MDLGNTLHCNVYPLDVMDSILHCDGHCDVSYLHDGGGYYGGFQKVVRMLHHNKISKKRKRMPRCPERTSKMSFKICIFKCFLRKDNNGSYGLENVFFLSVLSR